MQAETVGKIARVEPMLFTGNPEAVKEMLWLFYGPDESVFFRSKTSLIVSKLPKIFDAQMKTARCANLVVINRD